MEEEGKQDDDGVRGPASKSRTCGSLQETIRRRRMNVKGRNVSNDPVLEDPYKKTNDLKTVFRQETAYCFVPSAGHFSPWDETHQESPNRANAVNDAILPLYHRLKVIPLSQMMIIEQTAMLFLVHTRDHIVNVNSMCEENEEETAQLYDSIYFNGQDTQYAAIQAAKMTLTMAKLVAQGTYQNGFANVRPPGHHATPNTPNGYCFFNNVAIAAKYLLSEKLADKILIVDFDVHHGQGTQEIFYESDRVLYFSIHRYEYGKFWPNLAESNFDFVGSGRGKGFNINVPLNDTGLNDYDYMAIITNILLPVAYEFNPSMILLSAGYDACIGCPEYNPDMILMSSGFDSCIGDDKGRMNLTPAFYSHLTTILGGLAGGKILAVLEGGYFLPSLGEAALHTVRALLNDPCPRLEYHKTINQSVIDSINNVKVALREFWTCFGHLESFARVPDIVKYDRYNYHVAVTKHVGFVMQPPFPTRSIFPSYNQWRYKMYEAHLNLLKDQYVYHKTRVGFMVNTETSKHDPPQGHQAQETNRRLAGVMKKLEEFNLLGDMTSVSFDINLYNPECNGEPEIWQDVKNLIYDIHSHEYLDKLEEGTLGQKSDLYSTRKSFLVCHHSCAIICQLAREIKSGAISSGVGIVRPPGHHAKRKEGGGFCLVNNVVVAANFAIRNLFYERVLILDFDVHHGDGTQDLTYSSDEIMYISMHRYDEGKFFPMNSAGDFTNVGEGGAAGYNINIAFENGKMGSSDYLHAWLKLVMPVTYAFNPQLIIVSAGFDAGINDPLGRYEVYPEVFGHFIRLIRPVAPIILALEGGYNLETTSLGMVNCVRAMLGHSLPMPTLTEVSQAAAVAVANSISVVKHYWPILAVNKVLDPVIRKQANVDYATKFTMKLRTLNMY